MIDQVEIWCVGGNGGAGAVSFRREKFVPRGGPDGGDGGQGGDVVLSAEPGMRTLAVFRRRRRYRAGHGGNGRSAKRHGRNGKGLVIRVPVGTLVWKCAGSEEMTVVADLVAQEQSVVVARGGKGGRGNTRFASATHQAPRIAETGQKGEEYRLVLDLKLLSDVGVVGLPNVGKSTLLRAVSRAQPKVAGYPFTTLEPCLGVVEVGYDSFVVAEIPGLIERAHEGAGLGLEFLRHIERTRVVVHLLDGSRSDPRADLETVNRELEAFDVTLLEKRQIVAVNKLDLPEVRAQREVLRRAFAGRDGGPYFVSAATGEGVSELIRAMAAALQEEESKGAGLREVPVLRPEPRRSRFTVTKVDGGFRVAGDQPVALVEMLGLESDEARAEVMRRLARMGVVAALRRAGVQPGDRVWFGEVEMEWEG